MEAQLTNDLYFGSCVSCGQGVYGVGQTCKALGKLYHDACFTCTSCSKKLRGKPFFYMSGQVFCEEDFLYSDVHPSPEICNTCGYLIKDMVLQALGKTYHPECFCCVICKENMEGKPYTVDSKNTVYCVKDYYKVVAPNCEVCKQPILPTEGSRESIRIVSMDKSYHVECYQCEVNLT